MAARLSGLPIWSPERREYFRVAWQAGVGNPEIIATLNAMEGRPFQKRTQLADEAKRLGIRRPEWYLKEAHTAHAIQINKAHMPQPPKPRGPPKQRSKQPSGSPIKAPLHVIYRYGCELRDEGLLAPNMYDDIDAINRAIQRLSHERLSELFPQFARYSKHPGFQLFTQHR